ncbi:unnamed protein product [Amoebophrya sp. A120]|nr:unnamed protein product [Amoebophrya sp. A120]|eukprot:GSA120T00024115001.1
MDLYPSVSRERKEFLVKLHHNGGHFSTLAEKVKDKLEREFYEGIAKFDLCHECAAFSKVREVLWPVGFSQFSSRPRLLWGGDSVNTAMGIVYHSYDFGSTKRSLHLIDHHLPDKFGADSAKPPPQVPAAILKFKTKAGGFPRFFLFDPKTDNLNKISEDFLADNDIQGIPVPYASPWVLGKEERAHTKFSSSLNKVLLVTGATKVQLLEQIVGMRNVGQAIKQLVDVIYNSKKLDADQFELKDGAGFGVYRGAFEQLPRRAGNGLLRGQHPLRALRGIRRRADRQHPPPDAEIARRPEKDVGRNTRAGADGPPSALQQGLQAQ